MRGVGEVSRERNVRISNGLHREKVRAGRMVCTAVVRTEPSFGNLPTVGLKHVRYDAEAKKWVSTPFSYLPRILHKVNGRRRLTAEAALRGRVK